MWQLIWRCLIILAVLSASACIRTTQRIEVTPGTVPAEIRGARWAETPIHYCVVRDGQGFVEDARLAELLREAFARWGVTTVDDGACPGPPAEGNGRNEVSWARIGAANARLSEAGTTRVRYHGSGGGPPDIVEADIVIDSEPPPGQRNPGCLLTTLLHETGHFLGLHHLPAPAVMAPFISECVQELTQTDRDALNQLY